MRILVVEDEVKFAAFLQQALEENGQSVDAVHDGEEGLRRALDGDYDLLVLDWLLPGRDGGSLCAAVRATGSEVPILMLTARDAVHHRVAGLDAGADDYLTKPFALVELLARVRALLRRRMGTPTLKVRDLTLDPATRHVRRGARDIALSAKEYSLLEYLMRHARQTVTRPAIIAQVPGFEIGGDSNLVDVYINYLRNKVDREQPRKLIQTVRGVGYQLDDDCD